MGTPGISRITPVFGIGSSAEANSWYVEWLGFNLDWEWREAPGRPAIMAISMDEIGMMLYEFPDRPSASWLNLYIEDLSDLAASWDAKRPGQANIIVELPYDIPTINLVDPWGNKLDFSEPVSATEEEAREERKKEMRELVRSTLDAGSPVPSAQELVDAVGRPLGIAIDVLNEFPEYEEATRPN